MMQDCGRIIACWPDFQTRLNRDWPMQLQEILETLACASPFWLGIPLLVLVIMRLSTTSLRKRIAALQDDLSRRQALLEQLATESSDEALAAALSEARRLDEAILSLKTDLDKQKVAHRAKLDSAKAAHRAELNRLKAVHTQEKEKIPLRAAARARARWLVLHRSMRYRNEIEVEVKFVCPLLRYLGIAPSSMSMRYPVRLKLGSQDTAGEADWVIWKPAQTGSPRPAQLVIEAKSPSQQLDDGVAAQARSYAFALDAPYYLITNGRQMRLFKRGIEGDTVLRTLDIMDSKTKWEAIANMFRSVLT